jgi:hypothetical protein
MEPLATAIHHHLTDYLTGAIALDELKDRIVAITWSFDDTTSSEARQLAYDVELVLAEESSGYLTREELHADLRELVDRVALSIGA